MIIADENIEQHWIDLLRKAGFEVLSIRETQPGIADEKIVELVKAQAGILLTEDKDFGELIFAHGIGRLSVVFLRYDQPRYKQVEQSVLEVLSTYHASDAHFFITITPMTIRFRNI